MSGASTTDPDLFATIPYRTPAGPLLTPGISHEITPFLGLKRGIMAKALKKIINQPRTLVAVPPMMHCIQLPGETYGGSG